MQVPPPWQAGANEATAMPVGPVSVVFAGVAQSAWNLQRLRLLNPKLIIRFGVPAGGGVAPSRSLGRTPPKAVESWKHCCVAAAPVSILARSKAHSLEPAKVMPLLKML